MTTTSASSGDSDPAPDAEDEPSIETLADIRPSFDCEISVIASVKTEKGMRISERGHISSDENYSQPDWRSLTVDEYRCYSCDETFDTESDAKAHLQREFSRWQAKYALPGIPEQPTDPPARMPTFTKETEISVGDIPIQGRADDANTMAVITDSIGLLIATSRQSYSLPPNYEFDNWEPLSDSGDLTYPNGHPRIGDYQLKRAIRHLSRTNGVRYKADKFTLYDRGDKPFLLVAHGEAIVIAPRITSSPAEE